MYDWNMLTYKVEKLPEYITLEEYNINLRIAVHHFRSWVNNKKHNNKSMCATDDKQVINQSTSKGKNYQKKKSPANNLSIPTVIEVLTEQVQKNRSASVTYTWSAE
ncbi:hypothetical protein RhiirA5_435461 [Rhizophagus irregularis]|uniref:Uncharacterized protein n=1 Tax=Rhizophagus irregularis TaxID=588596 RepID=A0A2N0NNH2_9GLOM|nr:hypothetical protein RhiirA5_435461 [Rhizophagus irregularis]